MAVVAKVCGVRVHCNCFFSETSKKVKRSVTNTTQTLRVLSTQTLRCCPSIRFSVVLHCPQLLTSCWVFCGTRQHMLSVFLIFPLQQTFFQSSREREFFFMALSEPCTMSSEIHTYTGWIQPLGTWRFSQVHAGTSESQASPPYGWESTDLGLYFNGFQVTCFSKLTHFLFESATPIFKHCKQSPCTDLTIWIPPWSLIFLFFPTEYFKHVESKMVQQPTYNAPDN